MKEKKQQAELYSSELIDQLMAEITPEEQERTNQRMLIASKIEEARKQNGLSKGKFAALLNKKPSEISRWLSGTHNFSLDTLTDIQRVLGVRLLNTEADNNKLNIQYNIIVSGNSILTTEEAISLYSQSTPYNSISTKR
jgi:transcriptional regulator with XRE-family HTH domain